MKYSDRELSEVKSNFPDKQEFFEDLQVLLESTPDSFRECIDGIYAKGSYDSDSMTGMLFFVMQLVSAEDFAELPIDPMEMLVVSESVSSILELQHAEEVEGEVL